MGGWGWNLAICQIGKSSIGVMEEGIVHDGDFLKLTIYLKKKKYLTVSLFCVFSAGVEIYSV